MNLEQGVLVIDDFYRDPDAVRGFALGLGYENESTPNYPGYQSTLPALSEGVIAKFKGILGDVDLAKSRYQMGFFRFISAAGQSRLHVHTDLVDWTAVVYLTPEPDPACGTSFFRHRATGLMGPPDEASMSRLGYADFADYERKLVERDTLDPSAWEEVKTVENRYNRCVIFRSSELYHSHSRAFGDRRENARLTQNFFIKLMRPHV